METAPSPGFPVRRGWGPAGQLRLAAMLLILGIGGLGGWMLRQTHDTEVWEAGQATATRAAVLGENVRLLLATADAFLSTASTQLRFGPDGSVVNAAEMQKLLSDWTTRLPIPASFVVGDRAGRRAVDTRIADTGSVVDLSRRRSYLWAREDRTGQLALFGPVESPLPGGGKTLNLVRRIQDGAGNFEGAIGQVIAVDALSAYLSQHDPEPGLAVSLLQLDPDAGAGVVLARSPMLPDRIGDRVALAANPFRWLRHDPGIAVARATPDIDGVERLIALHAIPEYGLAIVVARPWERAVGGWLARAAVIVASMLGTILIVVIATVVLIRQIDARIAIERRVARELAERRRAELEANQAKLDSMARLSGGMAHEFNNLLQPICSLSELGLRLAATGQADRDRMVGYFARILDQGQLASSVASDFLTFCGGAKRPPVRGDLAAATRATAEMLTTLLPEGAQLRLTAADPVMAIHEPVGLSQLLVNLVRNAVEAAVGADRAADLLVTVSVAREGDDGARLCVEDNGPGMSDQVRARAFEPFFTTKGGRGGTGLGLAVAYGIVTGWGGNIAAEVAAGGGTRIVVTLPAGPVPTDADSAAFEA